MLTRIFLVLAISVTTSSFADDVCNFYGSYKDCRDKAVGTACTEDGKQGVCSFSYFRACECAEVKKPKKKTEEETARKPKSEQSDQ